MRLLLALLLASTLPVFAAEDLTDSDSGIYGPKYSDMEVFLAELAEAQPWIAQTIIYGKSVEGRNLVALKIKAKNFTVRGAPIILIAGSIHGDEYLNLGDSLARWFLYEGLQTQEVKSYIDSGGEILIIPVLNPDGYEARRRQNSYGIDLNRDFDNVMAGYKGFTQPESRSLAQFVLNEVVSQKMRLAVTVDYHCCSGDMLYPFSYTGPKLPEEDQKRYNKIGAIISHIFRKEIGFGTTPTLLGYNAVGTTKDYYYETYRSLSFTFEGRFRREDKMLPQHIAMWNSIIRGILMGEL